MPMPKIKPTIKVCPWCKKEFETGGRGRAPKSQIFCSKSCMSFGRVRNPKVSELSESDAAYLAGIIDGEGSIIMVRQLKGGRRSWRLSIPNTSMPLLEWIQKKVGNGTIHEKKIYSEKHSRSFFWQIYSWNALEVLKQCLPYMIIKRDLALDFIQEYDAIRALWDKGRG